MRRKGNIKGKSLPDISEWKKEEFEKNEFQNYYLYILFIFSLLALIHGISIYRLTFIEFKYLFLSVGLGALAFWFSHVFKFSRFKISSFTLFIYSLVIGGGLLYSLLLFTNYYLAEKKIKIGNYKIENTGTLAKGLRSKCGQPYAEINYKGHIKQLFFGCQFGNEISNYQYVELKIYKGFLGFDIVEEQRLLKV